MASSGLKGESAKMATTSIEKGDRAAVVVTTTNNTTPPTNIIKEKRGLDVDVLEHDLDILFVGYRTESSLAPILSALSQSSVVYPKLSIGDGAAAALEQKVGFLHVANELGDSAAIKANIATVIQKLVTFKPRLVCFSGSTIWRVFVNSFAPEVDTNDVYYGLQDVPHPVIEETVKSVFYVLPSQLLANQALTLFAEIRFIKEKISCLRLTQAERNLGVGDLRQELFQKTRSSAAMLIPTTPLTPTLPNNATTTTHIVNEKKSKKRAAEDYRHGNIKIQRGLDGRIIEPTPPPTTTTTTTSQHRLAGGGINENMLKDPSENERMDRVKKWVNEQDFDRASPEPNLDPLIRPLAAHDLYKQPTSGLLAAAASPWAAAAPNQLTAAAAAGAVATDPASYLSALQQLIPSSFPAVPIGGLPGQLPNAATWPYGGMSSLYLRPPTLSAGHIGLTDWDKMMGTTTASAAAAAELLQQSEASRVIPAFGIGLIQAQHGAFILPTTQTPMIYPPGSFPTTQDKDTK